MADTNSTQGYPVFGPRDTAVPFETTLRVVPAESQGRRMVSVRSGQLTAKMIEDDLVNAGWNIATPVTYVPAYGNNTAKVKVRGFVSRDVGGTDQTDDVEVFQPASQIYRFANGTVPGEGTSQIAGYTGGGNLSFGQEPSAETDTQVYNLITSLGIASSLIGTVAIIEKVELAGVKYGKGARSFPQ